MSLVDNTACSSDQYTTFGKDEFKGSSDHASKLTWNITRLSGHLLIADIIFDPWAGGDGACVPNGNVDDWIQSLCGDGVKSLHFFKLVMPADCGYVTCSRLLEQRLAGIDNVSHVQSRLLADQYYHALDVSALHGLDLETVFRYTGGAIRMKATADEWHRISAVVNNELLARLNLPWVLPQCLHSGRRLALIRGRMVESSGRPVYEAVASLGIPLVVVDEANHWARPDTETNTALRESFIVADMTEDEGLIDRLVACIRNHPDPIHGVFTCSDNYFVAVAEVAERLGFATAPSSAYKITVDKHLSRSILQDVPGQTARVANYQELRSLMDAGTYDPASPVIVKPVKGWSSECVSRVDSIDDLPLAIEQAVRRHNGVCVLEPYFDGPELDVNFVMLNGKVLFSDIGDEPPREGDESNSKGQSSFSDVTTTSPSALPKDEQELVTRTLHDMLLKIGMKTGVFHTEARLVGSRCHYGLVDGVIDLIHANPGTASPPIAPVCRLIEINARPPGFSSSASSLSAYGVNYFQVHALAALGDHDRLKALSMPYDFFFRPVDHPLPRNAQSWVKLMHISAPSGCGSGGVLETKTGLGPVADLLHRRPELFKDVYVAHDDVKHGDPVDEFTAGGRTCIAHLGVRCKSGRTATTAFGDRVKALLDVEIVH
ncbi:hypothetical protein ANO11243_056110 [Dothideomycetidae sp. 11243]|nr:hypothetical protein ANO11243_056110 [fungal sp. No.11243]